MRMLLSIASLLLPALSSANAQAISTPSDSWNKQAAAEYLDGRADWWLNWSGAARGHGTACLSCHTSMPFALARPKLGDTATDSAQRRLLDIVQKRVENWEKIVSKSDSEKDPFLTYYSGNRKPSALGTEAVLNALILVNNGTRTAKGDLSVPTRQALGHLWRQQQEDGSWLWLDFGLNPWENESAYYGASLAALAVGMAGKSYYDQTDVQKNVATLRNYLKTQHAGQPLHHRAFTLWASSRLPGILIESDKKKLIENLLELQLPDGGWTLPNLGRREKGKNIWQSHGTHPPDTLSDGYATGLVVLALKSADLAGDPKVERGIRWLVGNQKDGTWPIHYPNKMRDPQENIGKFMRDAATAFAVLALTDQK